MSSLSYTDFVAIRSAINTTNVGTSIMMPVGGICMYPSATPPAGYLLCDGATITIEDYPNLYTIIGNTFNAGGTPIPVGSFSIPDMRGRFVVGNGQNGTDAAYNINDKGGERSHVLTTDEVGEHTHGIVITDGGHNHAVSVTNGNHTHGITDNGHSHTYTDNGHTHGGAANTLGGLYIAGAPDAGRGGQTDNGKINITIDNAATNIGIVAAPSVVDVSLASAVTSIGATIGTTAVATGHENRPPYIALAYIIRAV